MSSSVTINCRHDTVNNFFRAVTAGAEHWFLLVSNSVLLLSMTKINWKLFGLMSYISVNMIPNSFKSHKID